MMKTELILRMIVSLKEKEKRGQHWSTCLCKWKQFNYNVLIAKNIKQPAAIFTDNLYLCAFQLLPVQALGMKPHMCAG